MTRTLYLERLQSVHLNINMEASKQRSLRGLLTVDTCMDNVFVEILDLRSSVGEHQSDRHLRSDQAHS